MFADPPEGLDASGLTPVSIDRVAAAEVTVSVASSLALICAKASSNIIKEFLKADPSKAPQEAKRLLEDRVIGEFFRMPGENFQTLSGSVGQDHVAHELSIVPVAYLPLLTHFKPRELVAFLVADDDSRESMMRDNPPEMDQKIDTLRALHSGKLSRAWQTTRQSLIAWEGKFSSDRGVTLASSFGALQDARNKAKKQQATVPKLVSRPIR